MDRCPKVLLIGAEDEENLAIRSLSAFLNRKGCAARIAGFSHPADTGSVLKQIRRFSPDLLAASAAFQCNADAYFALLRQAREAGYRGHVVVGGHFPTFEYRRILETQPAIDSVLRYEGEHGIGQLAGAVAGGTGLEGVPNLVYRTPQGIAENPCVCRFMDLDALPLPDRGRRPHRRLGERFATLISSRGCWHSSCLYCCIGTFHREKSTKFTQRSAASVAGEIALLHRRKGVNLLQFHDDNFVLPSPQLTCRRIQDLHRELASRGVRAEELAFLIKARPDVVDAAVAEALADLGCVGVFLGVENATESGLRALCRGADGAGAERAMACLADRGIAVTYNLLVFHPHATMDEIRANAAFVRRHPAIPFDFGRAEIVAGSPLEQLVVRERTRCGSWPMWDYRLSDPVVQRAFDVNRATFRAPHSGYSALMHALIALCYHAAAARRLHAGPSAEALAAAVAELIASSNRFVAGQIDEMIALAQGQADHAAVDDFGLALEAGCREHLHKAGSLQREMLRLQAAERVFGWFGIRRMVQELPLAGVFGVRKGAVNS
jgi:radical SAM superfamily enzyme YgiQ (UPF0313 family)